MKLICAIIGILVLEDCESCVAQRSDAYLGFAARGNLFYLQGKADSAIYYFDKAFARGKPRMEEAYKMAGAYSLFDFNSKPHDQPINCYRDVDRTYVGGVKWLNAAMDSGFADMFRLEADPYFEGLRSGNSIQWNRSVD